MLEQLLHLNKQVNESIQNLVTEKATEPFGKTDWLKSQDLKAPKDYVSKPSQFNGQGMMRAEKPFMDPFKTASAPQHRMDQNSLGPVKTTSAAKSFIDPFKTPSPVREPDPAKAGDRNVAAAFNNRGTTPSTDRPGKANPTPTGSERPDAPAPKINPNMPTSKLDSRVQQVTGLTFQQTKDKAAELLAKADTMGKEAFEKAKSSITAELNAFNQDQKGYLNAQLAAAQSKVNNAADKAVSVGADIGYKIEKGVRAGAAKAVEVGKEQGRRATQHGREAMADPQAWAKRNPGEAAKAGLAGVAAVGGSIYAATQMAKHSRWKKNGCEGISNPDEKARCKNYLKSNK